MCTSVYWIQICQIPEARGLGRGNRLLRDGSESSLPKCKLRKAAAPVLFDCQTELR
jgi:hypothetical protein